ncbi:MAG: VWA domain-containing protein [Vicinamibacterales bacterium]
MNRAAATLASLAAVASFLALAEGPLSAQQKQPPPAPSGKGQIFRAGVELVSLSVTVTDREGRYVTDLTARDFQVFEDGVNQELRFFDRSNLPLALSLLLDTSASMEGKLEIAQEAAVGFARRLREEDAAQLVDFDSRVQVIQPFTNDANALERAIRSTTYGGSTSLYNAVYVALKEMRKAPAYDPERVRRQAIVLLSDGEDTSSLVTFEQVLDVAKRSETAVYAIGLRLPDEAESPGFKEADFALRELTAQTGGRVFFTPKVENLSGIYEQISDELSSQYLLGYTSTNTRRDGTWRRVVVRVARPGLTARTKQGYYAPGR